MKLALVFDNYGGISVFKIRAVRSSIDGRKIGEQHSRWFWIRRQMWGW
jgi:hypothetical protein